MAYDDDFWGGIGTDPGAANIQFAGPGATPYAQGMGNFGGDPFGYTNGSLLTPWTQQFVGPSGGGGINMQPFSYGDFSYGYRPPDAFSGQTDITPTAFGYGEFQSPADFKAPTAADMKNDPSYQFRLKQGQDAATANAAMRGMARSGNFAKALSDYNQDAASQEYDKVYGRKLGEYQMAGTNARQDWDRRFSNARDVSDMDWQRQYQSSQANNQNRLAAYSASTDANIRGNQLGYDIATGAYDRNRQNAKDAYESAMQIAQANASAGSQAYNRALDEYQMNYGIFKDNQNTQWNRMMQLSGMGMDAAGQQAGYGGNYAANQGNTYGQAANAAAGAKMAGANAIGGALSNIGNAAMQAGAAYYMNENGYGGGGGSAIGGYDNGVPWLKVKSGLPR